MNKVTPTDEEYIYTGSAIVSQTDLGNETIQTYTRIKGTDIC